MTDSARLIPLAIATGCNIMPIIFEYNLHYNRGLLLDLVERCRIRLEVNRSPGSTPGPRFRVYSVACNCLY